VASQNYQPEEEILVADILDTITADADAFEKLTTEGGSELSGLIRQANTVVQTIGKAEEAVKSLKATRDKYLYDLIPAKMTELGMDKVEVEGNSVSLTTFVSATMPKDPLQKDLAIQHLRSIGCGDFIKNKLEVSFGLSQDNEAKALEADLVEAGHDTSAKIWVEPMTLKKLAKERLQAGQEFDTELFNAHIGTVAKIKGA
tara:strand:+ start:763 stop:1365 length:603 start_codon:yes stop_codon:yes gene_type:complete